MPRKRANHTSFGTELNGTLIASKRGPDFALLNPGYFRHALCNSDAVQPRKDSHSKESLD
jgi:hypothetical protein